MFMPLSPANARELGLREHTELGRVKTIQGKWRRFKEGVGTTGFYVPLALQLLSCCVACLQAVEE
jgi:hypothetical protein